LSSFRHRSCYQTGWTHRRGVRARSLSNRKVPEVMRKKLLIVEDNTELLELLRLALTDAGFAVNTAANGVEALKKARSLSLDLIVLDLVLPELDGFAVCEALKRDRQTASIPVIVVTGLNSEFSRFAGMESGADDFVTKPITPGELVSRIERYLDLDAPKTDSHKDKSVRMPGN
jgi:DNA-binding response OmpR family regulator